MAALDAGRETPDSGGTGEGRTTGARIGCVIMRKRRVPHMSYIDLRRSMVNKPVISQTSIIVDISQGSDISAPLLRLYTFGAFHLDWQVPPITTEDVWKSRTSARTLLKLLLCAPGRQASRSQLAGILWPETNEDKARESLRSASKVLRKVLRAASGEELLENRNNSTVLKLAEQSRLWVDVDVLKLWSPRQAGQFHLTRR